MAETRKINIQSCEILKDTGSFKTYKILDTDGNRYGATEMFDIGEQEVSVEVNGQYTNIKKIKSPSDKKGFPQKDYTFEKKKAALEAVVSLTVSGTLSAEKIIENCDRIYNWLR